MEKKKRNNIIAIIAISIIVLFFSGYVLRQYNQVKFYDIELERASREIGIMETVFIYTEMEDNTFYEYARQGNLNTWISMDRYSLTPVNYRNYFSNHRRLKEYCDNFFQSKTARQLENAPSWRKKEQDAFCNLRKAMEKYNSIDLIKCNPIKTKQEVKELLQEFQDSRKVLSNRLIKSKKSIYIHDENEWNYNE